MAAIASNNETRTAGNACNKILLGSYDHLAINCPRVGGMRGARSMQVNKPSVPRFKTYEFHGEKRPVLKLARRQARVATFVEA